jgi:hypothetical protein
MLALAIVIHLRAGQKNKGEPVRDISYPACPDQRIEDMT